MALNTQKFNQRDYINFKAFWHYVTFYAHPKEKTRFLCIEAHITKLVGQLTVQLTEINYSWETDKFIVPFDETEMLNDYETFLISLLILFYKILFA